MTVKVWMHPVLCHTGYRYRVTLDSPDGEEILSRSRTPACDASRLLHSQGKFGKLEVYRTGSTSPAMTGEIEKLRHKTVKETDKSGPYFSKYKEFARA